MILMKTTECRHGNGGAPIKRCGYCKAEQRYAAAQARHEMTKSAPIVETLAVNVGVGDIVVPGVNGGDEYRVSRVDSTNGSRRHGFFYVTDSSGRMFSFGRDQVVNVRKAVSQ